MKDSNYQQDGFGGYERFLKQTSFNIITSDEKRELLQITGSFNKILGYSGNDLTIAKFYSWMPFYHQNIMNSIDEAIIKSIKESNSLKDSLSSTFIHVDCILERTDKVPLLFQRIVYYIPSKPYFRIHSIYVLKSKNLDNYIPKEFEIVDKFGSRRKDIESLLLKKIGIENYFTKEELDLCSYNLALKGTETIKAISLLSGIPLNTLKKRKTSLINKAKEIGKGLDSLDKITTFLKKYNLIT